MAFPDSWLNELITKNDIVSVISSYVALKPKGRRLWGLCPLHGEKTASFSVSPDKQAFYCFGCHKGGSVVQFIMEIERLTFPEAVRFLAERVNMQLPEEVDDTRMMQQRAYRERLYEACQLAARFFMETLLGAEGAPGRTYLKSRGLGSDAVKRFGLGYAPNAWDALKTYLFEKGFTQQELLDAGLLVHNQSSNRVYDAYRGRVIFPIIGANGRVLGFGARVLDGSKPKYINTGDTPIYNKRNNLYGLNLQKGGKLTDLIMVEGYTDVIGLYEAGVTNVVASLGTALTIQQARLLKRYVETVYIAYDGDSAGQNATIRGLDILRSEGLSVRVIVFPDELDPDEFIHQHGKEAFDQLKDNALSLNSFKLDAMARSYTLDNENEREKYAMEACKLIASLQPIERDRCYQQLARKTGYAIEALKSQAESSSPIGQSPLQRVGAGWRKDVSMQPSGDTERARAETELLRAMLTDRKAAEAAVVGEALSLFAEAGNKAFAEAIVAAYATDNEPNAAAILAGMDASEAAAPGAVLREDVAIAEPVQSVLDCMRRIRVYDIRQQILSLTQCCDDPSISLAERARRKTELNELQLKMRGVS